MRNTIAVCMTQTYEEEFLRETLNAIYTEALAHELHVQVFCTFEQLIYNEPYCRGGNSIYRRVNYDRLCGMIILGANLKDNVQKQTLINNSKKNGVPVVLIDQKEEGCYSITFDHSHAIEQVVEHLVKVHNCKSFFVMGGVRNNIFSEERIDTARRVAAEYGIQITEDDIGYGDFWEGPCKAEIQRFLASGRPLPDAFISANDLMAITICNELRKAGYQVPRDTIVTGFDGAEEERYASPRLTTCRQDMAVGGKRAVEIIHSLMQHEEIERDTVIPFAVNFSESCGCLPIQESRSAITKVQDMFFAMKAFKQFTRFMYEMMDASSETRTLEGVLDNLPPYLKYVDSFQHIYLCVENDYLEAFDAIGAQIMKRNLKLNERREIDVVLLGEWHAEKGFEIPLRQFQRKDLLPPKSQSRETDYLIFVPLHVQDTVMGYLAVDFNPARNDYNQLRNFSANLSHILDNVKAHQQMRNFNHKLKKANDKLEELYVRDPLTGIYNRRGFYQNIADYIKAHNYGWIMTISVDLNGLKQINDNLGHGEGDFSIRTVGRALDKCVSRNGICARFGGDEFSAAVFYDEYEQYAEQEFRSQLMQLLEEVNRTSGKSYKISCSCGIKMAALNQDINIDELLKEADHKMYLEKKRYHEEVDKSQV